MSHATSPITTHVLDVALGRPAQGVDVILEHQRGGLWTQVGQGVTDADGRVKTLHPAGPIEPGSYRLTFAAGGYFKLIGKASFYQAIPIQFHIGDGAAHYHVPLLLSPFGYSTYRGS